MEPCVLEHGVSLFEHLFVIRQNGEILGIELTEGGVRKAAPLLRSVPEEVHLSRGKDHPAAGPGVLRPGPYFYPVLFNRFGRGEGYFGILLTLFGEKLGFQKGFFFAEADKFGILSLAKAFRPGKKPEGFHKIGLALGVFAGDYIDLFARRH